MSKKTSESGRRTEHGIRAAPVWLRGALSQISGGLAGFAIYVGWFHLNGTAPASLDAVLIAGAIAAIAGHKLFRMPGWWLPINAVFIPGLWFGVHGSWPPWIFAALFVVSVLIFWNAARDRVPLYLSNRKTSDAVAAILRAFEPPEPDEGAAAPSRRFCDLGSGTGGFAVRLARACPMWQVVGYENAPILVLIATLRARFVDNGRLAFFRRDFWNQPLGDFDVVYAFLSPAPMVRLHEKVRRELRPGAIFISNSFEVPGVQPDEVVELDDSRRTRLLIWRF